MKFGQLLENNKKNIFPQESCRKCGRETSSRPFCFFEKTLNGLKANGLELSFNIRARAIGRALPLPPTPPPPPPPHFLPCKKNKNGIFFHYIALFQVLTALLFYDVVSIYN